MELKNLRVSKKLSQRELANLLKVAPNTLSQWERGVRNPDPSTLKEIADFFNVSLDYLLGRANSSSTELEKNSISNLPSVSDEEYSIILKYRVLDIEDRADVRGYINGRLADDKYNKNKNLSPGIVRISLLNE